MQGACTGVVQGRPTMRQRVVSHCPRWPSALAIVLRSASESRLGGDTSTTARQASQPLHAMPDRFPGGHGEAAPVMPHLE